MVFWIFLVIMSLIIGGSGIRAVRAKNKPKAVASNLSWPAKQILRKYNDLPVENRPFENISGMLSALDVKHGTRDVNNHFLDYYEYRWNCDCTRYGYNNNCPYQEYKDIKQLVTEVADAIEKQKHALEVAKVEHDLEDIKTLMERMRQEKQIITSVTKELM